MTKTTIVKSIAAGFLLVALFAGVSGAQISDSLERSRYLNTGLFTVATGEGVNFHVALDDSRTAAPATVERRGEDRVDPEHHKRETGLTDDQPRSSCR